MIPSYKGFGSWKNDIHVLGIMGDFSKDEAKPSLVLVFASVSVDGTEPD